MPPVVTDMHSSTAHIHTAYSNKYKHTVSALSIWFNFTFSLSTLWYNVEFILDCSMTPKLQNTSKLQHLHHHHSEFSFCSLCRCWMANSNLTFINLSLLTSHDSCSPFLMVNWCTFTMILPKAAFRFLDDTLVEQPEI